MKRYGDGGYETIVGIDVSKAQLDVALGANEVTFSIANDEHGIQGLQKRLTPGADLVILEATGGLEVPVAGALAAAGIAVAVVNPKTGQRVCTRYRAAGQD
ncbi:MAG TPA: transposase [Candidatus Binataceae bacterium]|nr:transposase [Candidatus Binataceae bacterium]